MKKIHHNISHYESHKKVRAPRPCEVHLTAGLASYKEYQINVYLQFYHQTRFTKLEFYESWELKLCVHKH